MSQPHAEDGDPPAGELRLLGEVSWCGAPVHGGRTHALLAALVEAHGRTLGERTLVDEVWGPDQAPANPAKALQVVVSRTRAQTAPGVVELASGGYRLGLPTASVDALALRDDVASATAAEARGDRTAARDAARRALAGAAPASGGDGALADLRDDARRLRAEAGSVLGRSLSALGDHREALPLLEEAGVDDEATAVALLRSLAAVHGGPAALDRYTLVRRDLADRLGVDPGPALAAVHAELLAADNPVRSGLRHESTSLVGRDDDIRALRALVRESRVVSILGPGGLGKTRLAHLLGREAEEPVVHFVELVGVASPDDVVGEVGSALGVRDSVSGRRVLTPEQRTDVRARAAQALGAAPTLLILDNCEHVVEAVADLVAFLVAACPRLRVVTTTRAPLAISAERVFPLSQLDDDAASELFGQRARAARPGVALDPTTVLSVVRRLDGLPLAIELAAARVRAMSVEDIDRRLDDRFALLRGGDRTAPDRHQTLLAVIDWSWNLLRDTERRALRWLSTFHDGFSLDGADAVLGHDSLDDVRSLVDQSLLTVLDSDRTVRYRMLETVREFGRLQLVEAGEEEAARDAQLEWACAFALRLGDDLWSPRQVEAVASGGRRGEQPRRRPARGAHPPRPVVGGAVADRAGLVLDHPGREPTRHRRRRRRRRGAGRLAAERGAGRRRRLGRRGRRAQHRRRRDRRGARQPGAARRPRREHLVGPGPWAGRGRQGPGAPGPGRHGGPARGTSPRRPTGRPRPWRGSGRRTTSRTAATRPAPSPRPSWR